MLLGLLAADSMTQENKIIPNLNSSDPMTKNKDCFILGEFVPFYSPNVKRIDGLLFIRIDSALHFGNIGVVCTNVLLFLFLLL